MITKIYFPRMLLPAASVLAALLDFCVAFLILAGLLVWYRVLPPPQVLLLPVVILLAVMTAFGAGLWTSAASAVYRDVTHLTPFLVQVGFFVSPVVYETAALLPERWRLVYGLNPLVLVIEGFRWSLLGGPLPDPAMMGVSLLSGLALLLGGMTFFRRMEDLLADRV